MNAFPTDRDIDKKNILPLGALFYREYMVATANRSQQFHRYAPDVISNEWNR